MNEVEKSLLAEFGVSTEDKENLGEYYTFTSKITGKTVQIKLLPDDIIVDGELRRIIRDETGEIPDWAKPNTRGHGCARITPDGKVYGKTGKEIKTKGLRGNYEIRISNNTQIKGRISLLLCMHTSFNFEQYKKTASAYNLFNIEKGLDVTTLRNGFASKFYGRANIKKSDLKDDYDAVKAYKHALNEIIFRCRSENAYKNITINEDMKNLAEAAKWYSEGKSYRLKSNSQLEIEKDIAGKSEYSLKCCLIVPSYINRYFVNSCNNVAGSCRVKLKYKASSSLFMEGKLKHLGLFDTAEEAHQAWADFKNRQLQEVVIPYFINDVYEEDRNHPMVLKVIEELRNYT